MSSWPHEGILPREVKLDPIGHLPGHTHLFDVETGWAIRAALGARRPLLLRGEPGTGKSELARAAAEALKRALVSEVVTARSEAQDLHWRFDAVARLGQAQVMSARPRAAIPPTPAPAASSPAAGSTHRAPAPAASPITVPPLTPPRELDALDEARFVQPGALWWVFDWEGAERQCKHASIKAARPPRSPEWEPSKGCVLLIDEIDKADAEVPNGLLESLGNGEFHVPYFSEPIRALKGHPPPLVIITTNEERELPAAFVRRCLVLGLQLPESDALANLLVKRGRAHFGSSFAEDVYREAAALLIEDRTRAKRAGLVAPGQAEYLDLLRATLEVAKTDAGQQRAVLRELRRFTFDKNPLTNE